MRIYFISYGKAISVLIVLFVHFFTAFFNTDAWNNVTNLPSEVNSGGYLPIVLALQNITFSGIWGFLVVGAVCYFFLASGFMAMDSLRKRSFCSFWAHKFKRFFPFYVFVVCINMLLAKLGSLLYGVPFHHSLSIPRYQSQSIF